MDIAHSIYILQAGENFCDFVLRFPRGYHVLETRLLAAMPHCKTKQTPCPETSFSLKLQLRNEARSPPNL